MYHSTLVRKVIKKKKKQMEGPFFESACGGVVLGRRNIFLCHEGWRLVQGVFSVQDAGFRE